MGKMLSPRYACLDQINCRSSDARRKYEDGSSFCFSCETRFKATEEDENAVEVTSVALPDQVKAGGHKWLSVENIKGLPSRGFADRNISKEVAEFFNVKVSYDDKGQIAAHYYPYVHSKGSGYKIRELPKNFSFVGDFGGLFGMDKFTPTGKRLVITEGEIDAMAVAQATKDHYGKIYPVVSIPSATMTKYLLENRDWVRGFDEVVICFDMDEAGQAAAKKAVPIVGWDKAKLCHMPQKDASDVYLKGGSSALLRCIWDATSFKPAGIVDKDELWKALQEYSNTPAHPYPECLTGLNVKLKGLRLGDISLFISGTGSGKSTMLREIMLHILQTTDHKIGIVSLEETPAETAMKLSGMHLKRNPADEEVPLSELKVGFDAVFGTDRVVILGHQTSISDNSIVDHLDYMALSGCKYIFVDHITILVSEGMGDSSGNEAIDRMMNHFARLVKGHNVWVGLISHLRKAAGGTLSFEEGRMPSVDDIRGSGSIKQVSMDIVAFARNTMAEDDIERNKIDMAILKCRATGLTGRVAGAYYNHKTGRLEQIEKAPQSKLTVVTSVSPKMKNP
jgi:twinkle protein